MGSSKYVWYSCNLQKSYVDFQLIYDDDDDHGNQYLTQDKDQVTFSAV